MELEPLEKSVLEKLIFEERFDHILTECKALEKPKVIEDILKYLIQHKLVTTRYIQGEAPSKQGYMYDSDHMHHYSYQASAKGIRILMNTP